MISAIPLLVIASHAQTQRKPDTKLVEMTPVTQASKSSVFKMTKQFSIGGIVLSEGIQLQPQGDSSPDRWGKLVYTVPRGSLVFRGQYGIPDTDTEGIGDATLAIIVDGESAQEIRAVAGQKPTRFEIPLKGAKSIMLQFTGTSSIGDAVFSTSASTTTKPTPKPPQPPVPQNEQPKPTSDMPRANLTAPENGVTVKNSVTFKWDAVPNAITYGVEIVMITNADPKKIPTRFMRAFSAKSDSFEWNFSEDVLSGEYQVSVIAFGKAGVLTKFSNSRRFKVTRK